MLHKQPPAPRTHPCPPNATPSAREHRAGAPRAPGNPSIPPVMDLAQPAARVSWPGPPVAAARRSCRSHHPARLVRSPSYLLSCGRNGYPPDRRCPRRKHRAAEARIPADRLDRDRDRAAARPPRRRRLRAPGIRLGDGHRMGGIDRPAGPARTHTRRTGGGLDMGRTRAHPGRFARSAGDVPGRQPAATCAAGRPSPDSQR